MSATPKTNAAPARAGLRSAWNARRKRARKRGVALIMVMAAITILTVLLAEFQDETSAENAAAIADRDALKAEYAARSAINLSRLLIAAEPTVRTAIGPLLSMAMGGRKPPQIPVWEFSDRVLGAFNDKAGTQAFGELAGVDLSTGKNLGMEGASFRVTIVDEDSKINLNLAARGDAITQQRIGMQLVGLMAGGQYDPLFERRDSRGDWHARTIICGAMVDWADPDETLYACDPRNSQNTGNQGEDGYYQRLKKKYMRKNAPFDSLEELHLVRGVGDDFYATFVDPMPEDPKARVMTVWGQGTVNVNSANAQTIFSLVCGFAVPETPMCVDPEQSAKFLTAVNLLRSFTAGAPLFTSPRGFVRAMQGHGMFGKVLVEMVGVQPVKFISDNELKKAISTESKIFSIHAEGIVPGYRRTTKVRAMAVVDFRKAPGLKAALGALGAAAGGSGGPGAAGRATNPSGVSNGNAALGADEESIAAAMTPSTGGELIYFRLQ